MRAESPLETATPAAKPARTVIAAGLRTWWGLPAPIEDTGGLEAHGQGAAPAAVAPPTPVTAPAPQARLRHLSHDGGAVHGQRAAQADKAMMGFVFGQ